MSRSRQASEPEIRATSTTVSTRWTWRLPPSDWGKLLHVSRGALTVSTASGMWVVPPHQALWIPALLPHEFETGPGAATRALYIHPRAAGRLPSAVRAVHVSPLLRELLRRAILLETLDRRNREQRNLIAVLLDELATLPMAAIDLRMPRDPRAIRAAVLARSRHDARLTLADASRAAGASARTLERLFRAETGLAFGTWRQRARLLRALQLLAENENVTSAAIAVGYESTSAFVAAFRRAMGTTPGRYFRNGLA
jgi:AraC-like DNA-binding protein